MTQRLSEQEIQQRVAAERARLEAENGVGAAPGHFKRRAEAPFLRSQIAGTTVLFGGLTPTHDRLIRAVGESLGYRVENLPTPTRADYHTGRELCDPGMCNPTYFTAGALINRLREIQTTQNLTNDELREKYVFVTASSCGPCRFGMYEAQYRQALANAGWEGFRVATFEQRRFDEETGEEAGLELSARVFVPIFYAAFMADLLNEAAHQLRPYEVWPGMVDEALEACIAHGEERLRMRDAHGRTPRRASAALAFFLPGVSGRQVQFALDGLRAREFTGLLRDCRRIIEERVEADFLRVKPAVKITGEFWAQTTPGDGNFRLFEFIERHGGEVIAEPIATWFLYLAATAHLRQVDRQGLGPGPGAALSQRLRYTAGYWLNRWKLGLGYRIIRFEYERLRKAFGGTGRPQADQYALARLAKPYYNRGLRGGEGHLEIAKTLDYSHKKACHLIISVKPFGCLPSTQSDGAQAAVAGENPEIHFLSVETSGEGDVNAQSRILMALEEAQEAAQAEFDEALAAAGLDLDTARQRAANHPELRRPFQSFAGVRGIAGRAARFVHARMKTGK